MDSNDINQKLLEEIASNRVALDDMLGTIETIRAQTTALLPASNDFKNRHMMEEKFKAIAGVFGVELDIRKQKETSLKTEIELRRKLGGADEKITFDDVAELAKAIERMSGDEFGNQIILDDDEETI